MANTKKICRECGESFTPDKFHPFQVYCTKLCKWRWHEKHSKKRALNRKKKFSERREKAIRALGGKCALCGIDDILVLTIDHINGRKDDPFGKRTGSVNIPLLNHIIKNPEKAKESYQVLCWNHNAMKFFYPKQYNERMSGVEKSG